MTASVPPSAALDVRSLTDLLEQQRAIFQQVRDLGQQQAALIDAGQPEALLSLLGQRGALVERLRQLNGHMQPYRDQWTTLAARWAVADRQKVNALLDQIATLRDAAVAQDEHDCQRLAAARDQVGQELGQTVQTGRALGAYRSGPAQVNRYTDRQG